MTDINATQLTAEAWVSSPSPTSIVATQVTAEAWVSIYTPTTLETTQLTAEAWVAVAPPSLTGRSVSMMFGKLGAPSQAGVLAGAVTAQLHAEGFLNVISAFTSLLGSSTSQLHARAHLTVRSLGPPPAFDWRITVISQYANSPILLQLLENFFQYVDQTADINDFFDLLWNVDTAVGYGLDVWGRIVDVSRTLSLSSIGDTFGFEESPDGNPFNQEPFYGGPGSTQNFELSDDAYRVLIFAKALANISDGSIPAINHILMTLFGESGNCYVTDGNDMTMTYTFTFAPTPVQLAIIEQSGVLPKPCGVSVTIVTPP